MFGIFMTKGALAAGVVGTISILLTASGILPNSTPIVTTKDGQVQGRWAYSRIGNQYLEYLGIPFAEPPIGDLRFEAPVPLQKPWEGILDGVRYSPKCLQLDAMVKGRLYGVEDCLYLNVFTYSPTPEKLKPVMVYIHGGGFLSGATSMYGPQHLMDEDIILVTFNYRLGPLGFLSTGDHHIRGNMGLKDQNLAMKWTFENIEQFGGDKNRITLFGESAGAASAHLHMVSESSQGLFSRVILQSGALTCPFAVTKRTREIAMKYLNMLSCPTANMTELVACLKTTDIEDLVKLQFILMDPLEDLLLYRPSTEQVIRDDTFLPENPRELLKSGKFSKVPLMIGVTSGEGALRTARFQAYPEHMKEIEKNFNEITPRLLNYQGRDDKNEISEKIRGFYFGNMSLAEGSHEVLKAVTNLNSDRIWFEPIHRSVMIHAKHSNQPIYLYYYDYNSVVLPSMYSLFRAVRRDDWLPAEIKLASAIVVDWFKENVFGMDGPHDFGATHADDLFQLWNMEGLTDYFSGSDFHFSNGFVKAIVDFAKNEEPLEFNGVSWPPIKSNGSATPLQYMLMGTEPKMIDEPYSNRIRFWESLGLSDEY